MALKRMETALNPQ